MPSNNNINWLGNRVVDSSGRSPQSYRAARPEPPQMNQTPLNQVPQNQTPPQAPPEIIENDIIDIPQVRQGPPPVFDRDYIPGYLASNIGKNVRAEFIIGTSQYADKTGKLHEVGVNYFVLEDVNSRTLIMCDLYSVKFVTIIV